MLSFSGFLRRLTRDAVLAGVEDAMRFLEPQASHDVPARMAEQLAERLKRLHQDRPPQAAIAATPVADHLPGAVDEQLPHQQPAQSPKPESNGQRPTEEKPLSPRKRGRGRPKKHPHPHAH